MERLARDIGHPFSLAYALHHTCWLNLGFRLGAELTSTAEEQIVITTEQGFPLWQASGIFFNGAGLIYQGQLHDGLPMILKGLHAFQATGAELMLTYQFSTLGQAYTQAGEFGAAHRALDDGLALVQKNDERFQEAELHRLLGELHLAETDDQAAAEECFHTAIQTARRQQSRAWELRATTSLARLWQRQRRRDEARDALAAVYATYTEGFTTPDLVNARALLEALK
jgi:predicted ATPase